jgi:hypothetical protein
MKKLLTAVLLILSFTVNASAGDGGLWSGAAGKIAGFRCQNGVFVSAAGIAGSTVGQFAASALTQAVSGKARVFVKAIVIGTGAEAGKWSIPELCEVVVTWLHGPPVAVKRPPVLTVSEPILIPNGFLIQEKRPPGEIHIREGVTVEQRRTIERLLQESKDTKRALEPYHCPDGTNHLWTSKECLPASR